MNYQQYYPLIHSIINKYPSKYREDLFNECIIQLASIFNRFDKEKGTIQGFAYKRLNGHCKDFISTQNEYQLTLDNFTIDDGEESRFSDLIQDENDVEEINSVAHRVQVNEQQSVF
ncbi:sigma factor [Aestuariibaculum sp. YM273]|uniref:sigma factor n=1 Tax=Aestuariibaculum sp. YM273 TaxID=3070659 RepID=UPI0027DC49DD|nr:sigma factor [Aestuariibaculum sp. YM273]WMI65378.1 sigma factor [Aestuariibaculum sp. YM273]